MTSQTFLSMLQGLNHDFKGRPLPAGEDGASQSGPDEDPEEGQDSSSGIRVDVDYADVDSGRVGDDDRSPEHSPSSDGDGDGDLDDSVVEVEDGPEEPDERSKVVHSGGPPGYWGYDSRLSVEENMLRLQEATGIVHLADGLGRASSRKCDREGDVVPSVQLTARMAGGLKRERGLPQDQAGTVDVSGSGLGSPGREEHGEGIRNRVDFERQDLVGKPAREKDPGLSRLYRRPSDEELDPDALKVERRSVGKSTVGLVAARDFLEPVKVKGGMISPESYEQTYDISPFCTPEVTEHVEAQGFLNPTGSILSRMGGKRHLKQWLVGNFPRDIKTYVEPFGGSFQVLLAKGWRDKVEIINDVDADLVHFFRYAVFDPRALVDFINAMPTHEAVILGFRESLARGKLSGLERAAAYSISVSSSFNAMGFSNGRYASSPHVLLKTRVKLADVLDVAKRLRGVDIRCTSYERLLSSAVKRVPGGLFVYMDPPYDQTQGYTSFQDDLSFGWNDHVRLSEFCGLIDEFGGRFIQTNSYTDRLVELYGSYKKADGSPRFYITDKDVYYSVSGKAESRESKKELIISNWDLTAKPSAPQKVLF